MGSLEMGSLEMGSLKFTTNEKVAEGPISSGLLPQGQKEEIFPIYCTERFWSAEGHLKTAADRTANRIDAVAFEVEIMRDLQLQIHD